MKVVGIINLLLVVLNLLEKEIYKKLLNNYKPNFQQKVCLNKFTKSLFLNFPWL